MRDEFKSSIHQWKYKKKIDNFVESLQNKIMEKEKEGYNEYIFNLFYNYITDWDGFKKLKTDDSKKHMKT